MTMRLILFQLSTSKLMKQLQQFDNLLNQSYLQMNSCSGIIPKGGLSRSKWVVLLLMVVVYCCSCGDSLITLDANNQTNIIDQESSINSEENSSLVIQQDQSTDAGKNLLIDNQENLQLQTKENLQQGNNENLSPRVDENLQIQIEVNLQQGADENRQLGTDENQQQLLQLQQYPTWLNSSQLQYNNFLNDKYNYYITPQSNKIWVCVMSLAWTEMKNQLLSGHNATFSNMTQLKSHLVDNFNADIFQSNQLSQDSFYVHAGFGQNAVQRINFDIKKKFPLRSLPMLNYSLDNSDFISYAYLFKNFHFITQFDDEPGFFFKNQSVRAFHTKTSKQKQQLYVKYYNSSQDFMIGIKTQSQQDQIILWKTDNKEINSMKLSKVLQLFNMLYSSQSQQFGYSDKLIMPVVDLDYSKAYKELIDLNFTNPQLEQYHIKEMRENVKLKVTKEGVKLQAQGIIIGTRSIQIVDRTFYLDNDFWLIMKEKNKHPYLITLISTVNQQWAE